MKQLLAAATLVAVVACGGKDKQNRAVSDTAPGALAPDAAAGARTDTAMRSKTGTSNAASNTNPDTSTSSAGAGAVDRSKTAASDARARMAGAGRNFGLSKDKVQQLQTALNNDGCRAGPVDGVVGPKTRAGIACAEKKHQIPGHDMHALYQALHLSF